jgi:uncharacterized membrane protein YhaH (DUF805 family)
LGRIAINLWDVLVSIVWFMLLIAWFWMLISIVGDISRDEDLSGFGKGAWCLFVILLPWLGSSPTSSLVAAAWGSARRVRPPETSSTSAATSARLPPRAPA